MAKRNLAKYAEEGFSKLNARYCLSQNEIDGLFELSKEDMWAALITAFNAGVEAGYRIRDNKKGGNAK